MFKALAIGFLAATVAFPAYAKDVTIRNDHGGNVAMYAIKVNNVRNTGGRVVFAGGCNSACTMYLSIKNACIKPGAHFGFHLAYGASARSNAIATNFLMKSYPGWVKAWIAANGGLTKGIKRMNYAYASQFLPAC